MFLFLLDFKFNAVDLFCKYYSVVLSRTWKCVNMICFPLFAFKRCDVAPYRASHGTLHIEIPCVETIVNGGKILNADVRHSEAAPTGNFRGISLTRAHPWDGSISAYIIWLIFMVNVGNYGIVPWIVCVILLHCLGW